MNIAQAAAAGLLEVPGKDTTPSTTQTSTSEPSTTKPFTFGASTVPPVGPGDEQAASTIASGTGLSTLTSSSTQYQPFPFQVSTSSTASSKTIGEQTNVFTNLNNFDQEILPLGVLFFLLQDKGYERIAPFYVNVKQ